MIISSILVWFCQPPIKGWTKLNWVDPSRRFWVLLVLSDIIHYRVQPKTRILKKNSINTWKQTLTPWLRGSKTNVDFGNVSFLDRCCITEYTLTSNRFSHVWVRLFLKKLKFDIGNTDEKNNFPPKSISYHDLLSDFRSLTDYFLLSKNDSALGF